jgi:glycosyltransferase involved in cell wall biosynthesis
VAKFKDQGEFERSNYTVTFLSPGTGGVPTGGSKVMYEYANGLADRGWRVRIVHPYILTHQEIRDVRSDLFLRTRRWLGYQRRRITGDFRPDRWFAVRPNVEMLCTKTLDLQLLPPSDAWVATYWYTANWAATYPGAHFYLIQHLETLFGPESEVMATWKLPLRKIVISRWLEQVANEVGEPSDYIPNGLDFNAYGMDVAPEKRNPTALAMMYHHSDWKGSADGLAAIYRVKAKHPNLSLQLFGVPSRPADLPSWVEYNQNPPQSRLRQIYNQAAIFISPSWTEGWPLPPAEAQQCGASLAATDIGGHREYAHNERTALLSPAKDSESLAANLDLLIANQTLRIQLAKQGHANIQQFTWDRAVSRFEAVLKDSLTRQNQDSHEAQALQSLA